MKTYYFSPFLYIFAILLSLSMEVYADRTINSATLNSVSSTTVTSGSTVTAGVTVTTTGNGSSNNWESTAWRIGNSGNYTCANHSNFGSSGTNSITFPITAPDSTGTYNVSFIAYNNDSCTNGASSVYTLNNALTVTAGSNTVYNNTRNFSLRTSMNAQGDVRVIGNTILCKRSNSGQCTNPGDNEANNDFTAIYIDVDTDNSTTRSSSAQLALPANSKVLWAGLYWQGMFPSNFNTDKNTANRIKLMIPGSTSYANVTASILDYSGSSYQGFADVTSYLNLQNPNGDYYIADLLTDTGDTNLYGAWSLAIIYEDPADTLKNMTIYDGFKSIFGSTFTTQTETVNVSGFRTPLTGAVQSTFFIVAAEGDKAYETEWLKIKNKNNVFVDINNTLNPLNNVFNSNMTYKNQPVTNRNPNWQNTAGIDIDTYDITGILGNDQTSTQIQLQGRGADRYYVGVFGFSTQLYSPTISNFEKNATVSYASTIECDGKKDLRDATINYEVTFENTGTEAAANVKVYDDFLANDILDYFDMSQTTIPTAQLMNGTASSSVSCDKNSTGIYCDFTRINVGTIYKISFSTKIKSTLNLSDDTTLSNTANAHYFNASTGEEITQIASSNTEIAGGICSALPIAEYRMDECSWTGTSGEVKDSIGSNHGTSKTNTASAPTVATTVDTGQINRAGEFKGEGYTADPNSSWYEADYYIEIPDNSTLSPLSDTKAMTISGWFKPDNTNEQTIIHKGNGSVQEYRVHIENNRLNFTVWNQYNSPSTITVDTTTLSSNQTYFFAATAEIDASNNELSLNLYLKNGTNSYSKSGTFASFVYPATPGSLYIGAVRWGDFSGYFDGLIDEIKLFPSALSSDSITKIFNNDSSNKNYDGTSRSQVSCDLSPVADYHFDECQWIGTIGEVEDNSTNGYHGTAFNNANTLDTGVIGNRGDFTRNNDYVDVGQPNLNISNKVTVMAWVNWAITPSTGATYSNVISYNSTSTSDEAPFLIQHNSNNSKYEFAVETSSSRKYVQSSTVPTQNTWQHITGVYDGAYLRIYINGNEEANATLTGNMINPSNARLQLGQWALNSRNFNGYMDEVKIFNDALSKMQISTIYTNEMNGKNYDGSSRQAPCCCVPTGGNLIANPSFETLCSSAIIDSWPGTEGGNVYMRNNVCGWTMNGSGMETWENTTSKPASDGTVFVEIDGYNTTVDQLSQTLSALNGTNYVISFDYRARNGGSDRIIAKWNGTEIGTFTGITSEWQTAQIEVIGTGGDVLAFEEPSADNNALGSWIDNIRVIEGTLSTPKNYSFDTWDSFRSISDRNISTKIVNKPFTLTVAALDETNTAFQEFNGTVCAKIINNADQNISGWNKLLFSDQNSSTTTFTINRAIGGSDSARVKLYWKKNVDTTCPITAEDNSTTASDRFAVRPASFGLFTTNAVAGTDFYVDFIGYNYNGSASADYNETSGGTFDVSTAEHNAACPLGTFTIPLTPFSFQDGIKSIMTRYSDVGIIDINITDLTKPCTSRFAKIDCDDLNVSDGTNYTANLIPIGLEEGTITIIPHHFDVNATLSNFSGGTFTYLSDDLNMSAQLDLNITAKNGEGNTTTNYSSACYAKNTDLTLVHSNVPSPLTKILYTETLSTLNTTVLKDDSWVLSLNSTLFHSGSVAPNIDFNFDRSPTKPLNPFDFNITSATAADVDITGSTTPLGDTTFVYGRVHAYDITTNTSPVNAPIEFEVYSTLSSGFVSGMPQNVLKWYRNLDHDTAAAGNIIAGGFSAGVTNGDIDTSDTPIDGLQIVEITSINDQTVHLDISPWLWYSPIKSYSYSTSSKCTEHPCFQYKYTTEPDPISDNFRGSDFEMTPAKNVIKKGAKFFR